MAATFAWTLRLSLVALLLTLAGTVQVKAAPEAGSSDPKVQLQIMMALAGAAEKGGDLETAEKLFSAALSQATELYGDDDPSVVIAAHRLGRVLSKQAKYQDAATAFGRALKGADKVYGPDDPRVGVVLSDLAYALRWLEETREAGKCYERALAIAQKNFGERSMQSAAVLSNWGGLLKASGDFDAAQKNYELALAIATENLPKDDPSLATMSDNLAGVLVLKDDYVAAKQLQEAALAIYLKAPGDREQDVAITRANLADVFAKLGDYREAKHQLELALPIAKKTWGPDHPQTATFLDNLGGVYNALGDLPAAKQIRQQALAIYENAYGPDHFEVAACLSNLAIVLEQLGDVEGARKAYERALTIDKKVFHEDVPPMGPIISNLTGLLLESGDLVEARVQVERVLALAEQTGAPELREYAFFHYSALAAKQGSRSLAIFWGKQAVNTVQRQRVTLTSLDRSLQRSFVHRKAFLYRNLAGLLVESGRLAEAQEVMAMLKEEEYFDYVRRDAASDSRTSESTLGPVENTWHSRYEEIRGHLASTGKDLVALRTKAATTELSPAEKARRKALEADAAVAHQEFEHFLVDLQAGFSRVDEQMRQQQPGAQNLQYAQAMQSTLAQLGQGVVLINYVMGPQKLYIVVTTPGIQFHRESAIGFERMSAKIFAFKQRIGESKGTDLQGVMSSAEEMYDLLVAPIEDDLKQAGARILMVSLDGPLRYVPISALRNRKSKKYLVEDYALAMFTEAARDKLKDQVRIAQWKVAAMGVTTAVSGFGALPAVKGELEAIVREDEREQGILPGRRYLDQAFTQDRLQEAVDRREYPVVHIASHFEFHPGTETESFLVLGEGKHLTVEQMKNMQFSEKDLLTLSACETAIGGGVNAEGAEIEGLGALAQKQNAKAVIATLWKVADTSTAQVMKTFYTERAKNKVNKAEALQRAQVKMIKGGGEAKPPYAHPYYWAPFILMGNWL